MKNKTLNSTLYNIGEHTAHRTVEKDIWEQEGPDFSEEYEQRKAAFLENAVPSAPVARKSFRMRRVAVLAACVGALFATSLCVYAANKYFQTNVTEEEATLTYSFDIDYDLTPYEVDVQPTYLPEGYEEWEQGKYSYQGEYAADGISIAAFTAAHIDAVPDLLTASDVKQWEEVNLNGITAHVIEFTDERGPVYNRTILFYEQEGFIVEVFAAPDLAVEEMVKVAEGLDYTVTETAVEYLSEAEKEEMIPDEIDPQDFLVKEEYVHPIGEEIINDDTNIGYTVDHVEILDTIEGFDTSIIRNYEENVLPTLNEDGSPKDYERIKIDDEGYSVPDGTASRKILQADIHITNYSEESTEEFMVPYASFLISGSPEYELDRTEYAGEGYDYNVYASYDGMPFYFSAAADMGDGYYILTLAPGETVSYTALYDVDEDRLDNFYLFFNFSGMAHEYDNPTQRYISIK